MKTFTTRFLSRPAICATAALAVATAALFAVPQVVSYQGRSAPRTKSVVARPNPSLRQNLPFSASELVDYFVGELGTQPMRKGSIAIFYNPPGAPVEHTFAISVMAEEDGVVVMFTGRGDYAMTLAREFFESSFFTREETLRFYAMLAHPDANQTAPLTRFTVDFQVVDHPGDLHLTLRFTHNQI